MTTSEFLARARSQLKFELKYRLGGGKIIPVGEHCGDEGMSADCSSFVCWCARMRKYQGDEFWWLEEQNGGWLNTDGIYLDAVRHTSGNFEKLVSPKPGAIVVYPAAKVEGSGSKSKWGHVGIVETLQGGRPFTIIHCSSGNYRTTGRAVAETGVALFERHNAIFCWPSSVRPW